MKHLFSVRNLWLILLYGAIVMLSILIIVLHRIDRTFHFNFVLFYSWLSLIGASLVVFLFKKRHEMKKSFEPLSSDDWIMFSIVLILAITTRFLFLGKYPYVALMDEVRDGGLYGLYIKQGVVRDLFDYGRYDAHGNIIPFFSYLAQFIFPTSKMSYIVPAAIIGIFSVIVTYVLAHRIGGKMTAFAAGIFVIASQFHLHYSRTQIVNICDALLSPLILLCVWYAIEHIEGFFLVGMIFGFAIHFYAGIRGILIASTIFICAFYIRRLIRTALQDDQTKLLHQLKQILIIVVIGICGFIIGIGPTINDLRPSTIMSGTGERKMLLKNQDFERKTLYEKTEYVINMYQRSFSTDFINPVTSIFFFDQSPLLSFPVNWFFLIGIGLFAFKNHSRKMRYIAYLVVCIVLLFPLTNQVMVNDPSSDHRLMAIVPILNIAAAYGIVQICEYKMSKMAPIVIGAIVGAFFIIQTLFYFYERPSDAKYDPDGTREYVLQTIVDTMKNPQDTSTYILVNNNPYNFDISHYREKFDYFLYPKKVMLVEKNSINTTLVSLTNSQNDTTFIYIDPVPELQKFKSERFVVHCDQNGLFPNYTCPKNWTSDYSFFITKLDKSDQ